VLLEISAVLHVVIIEEVLPLGSWKAQGNTLDYCIIIIKISCFCNRFSFDALGQRCNGDGGCVIKM